MFEVETAKRQGARLLIQLSGVSGGGKTYTALQLAYGLAGFDASKVVGICTENRRMSLNADCLPDGAKFKIINFPAPFSPARYKAAIQAAVDAGAEVVVVDSLSHEWESEGGCEWIAHQRNPRFPDWKFAKAEHKSFVTFLLQCPAHIIACTRAREKTDFSNPKSPVSLGIQPIQEKNFSYEATASLMMREQGKAQDVLKCPEELQSILGKGKGYLTPEHGAKLREWVDGGAVVDPEIERARGNLQNTAGEGLEPLRAAWSETPPHIQKALGASFLEQCKATAAEWEKLRKSDDSRALDALNAEAAEKAA